MVFPSFTTTDQDQGYDQHREDCNHTGYDGGQADPLELKVFRQSGVVVGEHLVDPGGTGDASCCGLSAGNVVGVGVGFGTGTCIGVGIGTGTGTGIGVGVQSWFEFEGLNRRSKAVWHASSRR